MRGSRRHAALRHPAAASRLNGWRRLLPIVEIQRRAYGLAGPGTSAETLAPASCSTHVAGPQAGMYRSAWASVPPASRRPFPARYAAKRAKQVGIAKRAREARCTKMLSCPCRSSSIDMPGTNRLLKGSPDVAR